jgi:hypothetical protein
LIIDSHLEFAVIGVTVTQALALIRFDPGTRREPLPVAAVEEGPSLLLLVRLLHNAEEPDALEQVFALLVDVAVGALRRGGRQGMSSFSDVFTQVQRDLLRCLGKLPASVSELTVMMEASLGRRAEGAAAPPLS